MPNVPVPIIGPTYTSSSLPVSNQTTRNFYIEANQNSDTIAAFLPFPGLKLFATTAGSASRGVGIYDNEFYAVTDQTLYKVDSAGVVSTIGTITGTGRCVLQEDNASLVIANGEDKPWRYDGVTLTQGTDVDLPNASTVTYINNRVVYDGTGPDVAFADLGSPLSVDSSNVVAEDTNPDDTLAVKAFRDQLFVFSESSIVPYYNIATGNPPYKAIQNAVSEVGVKAIHSIASNFRSLYFLGSDLMPYRIGGIQPEPIGNPSIGKAIAGYANPENAWGNCFSFDNQYFYLLTFPGEESWLYSEGLGWTNLAYLVDGDPHLMYGYAQVYNKHLLSDRQSGNIYELDFETFTDNGQVIQHRRDTRKISGKDFQFPGKEIFMHRMELVVETGVGTISGQGSNPKIMMSFSDDGGRTWSPEQWAEFGALGEFTYSRNPYWTDLGSFYERQFRFTVTDPVKIVLISANADISIGP